MRTKILFAILTCNRLFYLRNCIKSILKFADLHCSKILIIDNCTIEEGIDDFYSTLPPSVEVHRFQDRVPNELYRAMNFGISYCMDNNIPIINFVQDDYQYVYANSRSIPSVLACFDKYKRVGQINTNMVWKRKNAGKRKIRSANEVNFAFLQEKRLVDNGFTRVKIYKKTGLYPHNLISYDQNSSKTYGFGKKRYDKKKRPNGEIWFGQRCHKLGYCRAISLLPDIAMMFDCAYVRKMQRFGRYFPPPGEFYIKPLGQDAINRIERRHDKHKFCYIEDMATPDGWVPSTFDKHNREKIVSEISRDNRYD